MTLEEEIVSINDEIRKLDADIRRLSDERWDKEQARQVLYDRRRDDRLRQQIQAIPYAHLPLILMDKLTPEQAWVLSCQGWFDSHKSCWTDDGLRAKVLYAEMVKAGQGVSPAQYEEELARLDKERDAIINARNADLARVQEQKAALCAQLQAGGTT